MESLQAAVSLALRDTEACTAAAEMRELSKPRSSHHSDDRCVLAVVTHKHHNAVNTDGVETDVEEGCLFVMKYISPSSAELYPSLLFPMDSKFTASLQQQSGPESSEFKVTLTVPQRSVMLGSSHMPSLSSVLEEARRLRKTKDPHSTLLSPNFPPGPKTEDPPGSEFHDVSNPSSSAEAISKTFIDEEGEERHWEWLHFYLSHLSSRILPSQREKPRDIRVPISGYELSHASAGLPGDENNDIALIRDHWIDRQLSLRRDEYSQRRHLRLRIGTFNVNGKSPTQSLAPWVWPSNIGHESSDGKSQSHPEKDNLLGLSSTDLQVEKTSAGDPNTSTEPADTSEDTSISSLNDVKGTHTHSSPPSAVFPDEDEDLPDIFIFGFQELDLSAEALLYSTSTLRADAWISAIFAALGKSADHYIKLTSKQLVGVLVVVIIRREVQSIVKEVTTCAAGVGLMGIMGNKGATAVRLHLHSTTVTFVCSHLAAFDDYVDRRNSDFAEIARKLEFPITYKGARRGARNLTASIWETDALFWLVNLNYRIDLPDDEVRMLLRGEPGSENSTLLVYDQLRTSAHHKRAFVDFKEHDIAFLPTYRFAEGLTDPLGYDKKRKPAWTDRILHLSADPTMVSQNSYRSCPMVTMSDHHPVSADFDIDVYEHDPHKSHEVATALFKKLGDFEDSAAIPTVSILDGSEVHLGDVSYMKPVSRSIRVRNDGRLACAFRFIPLDPGSPICKEWLQLHPVNGILLPGETESIQITVNVDKRTASFMNHGNTRLEDNIILHIAKGTDHIISVLGSYQPTCFANSLAWLVRSPGPIRTHGDVALLSEVNTLSAPRELMFLVGWLMTNAQDVPDLFTAPADESLVHIIREHLDTQLLDSGTEATISFPDAIDHSAIALAYGEALLEFLDSLTEPVIPWILHPRCAEAQNREDAFEILDDVPSFARNVYVTVTAFVHFIAQCGGRERSVALARVFADILLRDNPRALPGVPALTPLGKRNFLLYTIA